LFYEPSTRTRFSFEAAMLRLGGSVIGSSDPSTTSVSKGESLADTVRVIQNYADLIVLRHPYEGAAKAAADYADIPIINGGDGGHEHPTQTLCDLFTLRREKTAVEGLNVAVVGDLKNGRTVHSLVYALARFGANIITMPGPGFELPKEVSRRLEAEFGCQPIPLEQVRALLGPKATLPPIDVVYQAPTTGTQFQLFAGGAIDQRTAKKTLSQYDVCYVTRLQGERIAEGESAVGAYPIVNEKFLQSRQYADASVLHPLPRVGELGYDLDQDPRGVYFKQAGYGVPVRMALMAKLLGIEPFRQPSEAALPEPYDTGNRRLCANPRCITHHEAEQRYLPNKIVLAGHGKPWHFRCLYCETPVDIEYIGDRATRLYRRAEDVEALPGTEAIELFASEAEARKAHFHPPPPA